LNYQNYVGRSSCC